MWRLWNRLCAEALNPPCRRGTTAKISPRFHSFSFEKSSPSSPVQSSPPSLVQSSPSSLEKSSPFSSIIFTWRSPFFGSARFASRFSPFCASKQPILQSRTASPSFTMNYYEWNNLTFPCPVLAEWHTPSTILQKNASIYCSKNTFNSPLSHFFNS